MHSMIHMWSVISERDQIQQRLNTRAASSSDRFVIALSYMAVTKIQYVAQKAPIYCRRVSRIASVARHMLWWR